MDGSAVLLFARSHAVSRFQCPARRELLTETAEFVDVHRLHAVGVVFLWLLAAGAGTLPSVTVNSAPGPRPWLTALISRPQNRAF